MQEKIHTRLRDILFFLARRSSTVTLHEIAEKVGVSSKTIMRDLMEADQLLAVYGAKICRKKGQGIWLDAAADARERLLEHLTGAGGKSSFSPEERRTMLVSRLLQDQEPVKLFEFTSLLKVSEATISKDLDKLEDWFREHKLELVRRPGTGIYVNGSEKHIRKAIVHYVYENIDETGLIGILQDTLAKNTRERRSIAVTSSRRLLNLVNTEIIHKLEDAICKAAESMGYKLSDRSFIALIVHLALAVQRMQKNEEIHIEQNFLERLKECREFKISAKIAANLEEVFAIRVPENEVGYITMHVMGARQRLSDDSASPVSKFQLVCLAREMIKTAEAASGYMLARNDKLLLGLVNHLAPSISRMRLQMEIRNPLLGEMKEKYASLMELSRKAALPLEKALHLRLPEQEIAYLAMHFGAAVEEAKLTAKRRYRVAIACPTGVGSSRLLASKLRQDFARLEVVCTVSALHLDEAVLREERIDFVLSTTPLYAPPIKALQVSSILSEEDKRRMKAFIADLDAQGGKDKARAETKFDLYAVLQALGRYSRAIVALIEHFFLKKFTVEATVEELIAFVSALAADSEEDGARIMRSLRCREEISSTVVAPQQMMLLHCETDGVRAPYFGVARVPLGIHGVHYEGGGRISLAAVMLLPSAANPETLEVMGHLSEMLVEDLTFSQSIHEDEAGDCRREFERVLKKFCKKKNQQIWEEC